MTKFLKTIFATVIVLGACFNASGRSWNFSFGTDVRSILDISPNYVSGQGGDIVLTFTIPDSRYSTMLQSPSDIIRNGVATNGIIVSDEVSLGKEEDCRIFSVTLSIPSLSGNDVSGTISFRGTGDYYAKYVTQGGASLQGTVSGDNCEDMIPGQHFSIIVTGADNSQSYTLYRRNPDGTNTVISSKNPRSSTVVFDCVGEGIYVVGNAGVYCEGVVHAYNSPLFSLNFFSHDSGDNVFILPKDGVERIFTFRSQDTIPEESLNLYLGLLMTEMPSTWDPLISISLQGLSQDRKTAYIKISCPPNIYAYDRIGNTMFKCGSYNSSSTFQFVQRGGGSLIKYPVSGDTNEDRSKLIVNVEGSQPSVSYYLYHNGSDSSVASIIGNGRPISFEVSDTIGVYTVLAYYSDVNNSDECFMYGEARMPILLPPLNSHTHSEKGNWIRTFTVTDPSIGKYVIDAEYYNGLGLVLQKVSGHAGGDGASDIITPVCYDNMFNTETIIPLQYARHSGAVTCDSIPDVSRVDYYSNYYDTDNSEYSYNVNLFETSTGRLLRSRKPGAEYADEDIWKTYEYSFNEYNEVPSSTPNYYPAASLLKQTQIDEDGRRKVVFSDRAGKIRLERYYPNPEDTTATSDILFNYDRLGRLSHVNSGYSYAYDSLGRVCQKILPAGAGNETVLYDLENKPIYRLTQKTAFRYYYDSLGRLEYVYVKPASWLGYDALLSEIDSAPDGENPVYDFSGTLFQEFKYGEYMNGDLSFSVDSVATASDLSSKIRGLKTYEKLLIIRDSVFMDGTDTYAEKAFYYDYRGRVIQSVEKTHLGSLFRRSVKYDFCGNPLIVKEEHQFDDTTNVAVYKYSYDSRGRLIDSITELNGTRHTRVSRRYDLLGRISYLRCDLNDGISSEEYYSYTLIGQEQSRTGPDFQEHLNYTPAGLISSSLSFHGDESSHEIFNYDGMGRLADRGLIDDSGSECDAWREHIEYNNRSIPSSIIRYDKDGSIVEDLEFLVSNSLHRPLSVTDNLSNDTQSLEYDLTGNLTSDPLNGLSLSYNILNLPSSVSTNNGQVFYTYLSDGTKCGETGDYDNGYEYVGQFTYRRYEGDLRLESIPFGAGKIKVDEYGGISSLYSATDHLGSIRTILSTEGGIQTYDYYPYGKQHLDYGENSPETNEELFQGKTWQGLSQVNLYDFGGRYYQPRYGIWLSPDPLAEEYYQLGTYAFCAGNPINIIDKEGWSTQVFQSSDSTFVVTGEGDPFDGDNNIYVGYYKDGRWHTTHVSIGKTLSPFSFYDTDHNAWQVNSIINLNDYSGEQFIQELTAFSLLRLGDFICNAGNNDIYDFKETGGVFGQSGLHHYRGMPIWVGPRRVKRIASARDVGNYVAGYYAAANGFAWERARKAFDMYQGSEEGLSSQYAQYIGYRSGINMTTSYEKNINFIRSIPSFPPALIKILKH